MNPIVQICPSDIYMYILLTHAQHYLKSCHVVQLSLMSWILSYLVNELTQHLFAAWIWRSIQSICNSISKQAKLQLLYKFCKSALNSDWVIVLMNSSSTCVSSTSIKIKANVVYIYMAIRYSYPAAFLHLLIIMLTNSALFLAVTLQL